MFMTLKYGMHEAKTQLSKLVELALKGEEVILTRSGKAVARLVPIIDTPKRVPGRFMNAIVDDEAFFEYQNDLDMDWG